MSTTVLFSSLIQMTLITRIWVLIGLEIEKRYLRCGLFIVLSSITIWLLIPGLSVTGYMVRYIVYGVILFLGKLIFKKSWKEILYDFFTIIIIIFCIQSFQLIFHKLMFQDYVDYQRNINHRALVVIVNITFLLLIFFSSYSKKMRIFLREFRDSLRESPMIIISFVIVIILVGLILDLYKEQVWDHIYPFFAVTWLLYLYNFVGVKRAIALKEQKKSIAIYKQYYPIFSNIITDIRKKQHEFNNHLNTIYGLLHLGGMDWEKEIRQYIQSIKNNTLCTSQLVLLENRILAAVIYSKLLEAAPKDITFEYNLKDFEEYPIEDYELVEILCNLLNNAFEAVEQSASKEKQVILEMGSEKNVRYLEVRNNGIGFDLEDLENICKAGYTTKGHGRGYGLCNVMNIVKRNSGRLEVFLKNEYTVFRVSFIDLK